MCNMKIADANFKCHRDNKMKNKNNTISKFKRTIADNKNKRRRQILYLY